MATTIQRAETIEALAGDPFGKYFVGRTWLSFFAIDGRLSGTIVWGDPSLEDVEAWEACADVRLSPVCGPHATLFDGRKMGRMRPGAFARLTSYASRNQSKLKESITQLAVVHAGQLGGAIAVGFSKLAQLPFPAEIFRDPSEAFRWLRCEEDLSVYELLGRVQGEAQTVAPLIRALASFLLHHPQATPREAARELGLSTRTLQRRLAEQGTAFRRELDAARVRLAQRLLLDSEASVTEIALRVGLTSPQHLSTLFHKLGLDSPSQWRALARAQDGV